jgi:hypothetical protein
VRNAQPGEICQQFIRGQSHYICLHLRCTAINAA